ncbi:hypothetical protein Pelo_16390 [Pelomyxa schiedti]|nr:hypothetical protein Pelo_16390 [Pelomyxa schiedti]
MTHQFLTHFNFPIAFPCCAFSMEYVTTSSNYYPISHSFQFSSFREEYTVCQPLLILHMLTFVVQETALHLASRQGNVEIVKRLLSCVGIDPQIKNKEGKTAHECSKNDEVQQLFQSVMCCTIPAATLVQAVSTPKVPKVSVPPRKKLPEPPITITSLDQLHSLIIKDLSSFAPNKPSPSPSSPSRVLSKVAEDVINHFGKQSTIMEASVLMVVTDQLSRTLPILLDQHKVHQSNVENNAAQVEATEKQVALAQAHVQELEHQLAQAQQLLVEITKANTLAKEQLIESRKFVETTTQNIGMLQERQEPLKSKLASLQHVLSSLRQKASTRDLLQFDVKDIGGLLCELGLQKHTEKFTANEVDGEVFLQLNKTGFEELGVIERAEQDLLNHTRAMIQNCGKIRAPWSTRAAAAWDVDKVTEWLQSQGIPPQAISWFHDKGITGISLLFMDAQEISTVPGLPFGPRHKLLKRIGELQSQVYTPGNSNSSGPGHTTVRAHYSAPPPPEYLCPITCDLMDTPVVAADGYCYEKLVIEDWLSTHDTSPMTNTVLPSKVLVACDTLHRSILDWKTANNIP